MTVDRMLPTREAADLLDLTRQLAERELAPRVVQAEATETFPAGVFKIIGAAGLLSLPYPESLGGGGQPYEVYLQVLEELAMRWAAVAVAVSVHGLSCFPLATFGTPGQQERWLPELLGGGMLGAYSLSEAQAGSDAAALACKAERDGDEYVITGTKMWVTNGERAGLIALAARSDEGITCFIVEKEPGPEFGGITVSKNIGKLGYKGIETVEMVYDGHRVGADCVLGGDEGLGHGLGWILGALEVGRINIAARACGVARAAFEAAIRYAQERKTFGKPIAEHQAIQQKLADMATKLQAARLLTEHAARLKQDGDRADVEAGMAKLFASEAAFEIATESLRIHGGVGYTTELPIERYYRDAPLMIIGEGTNEIQRLVIARGLLKRYAID
jgi:alkylation response protein AidB-like acyl-CoA dehydrogenase